MKRLIFIALLVLAGFYVQGQVRFGLKGGMNVSGFEMSSKNGVVVDFSTRFAFHAGGFADIPIGGFFSIQPELLFSSKGASCSLSETFTFPATIGYADFTQNMKQTFTPCYIELPLYLKAGFDAGTGTFIVGVGPYIAHGVGGKCKAEIKTTTLHTDEVTAVGRGKMAVFKKENLKLKGTTINFPYTYDTEVEFEKAYFKRFDFGFAGFAGYELNLGFFVIVGFQKGLFNIDNFDVEGDKMKNKTFTLSVGYKF